MAKRITNKRRTNPIKYLLWALLGLGLAGPIAYSLHNGRANNNVGHQEGTPRCVYNITQVKSGHVPPQDYLRDREKCSFYALEAKREGVLSGFVYDPSDSQLESMMRISISKAFSDHELDNLVRREVHHYNLIRNYGGRDELTGLVIVGALATFFPQRIEVFGKPLPRYLIFTRHFFNNTTVNNDADVDSTIAHELQHVSDFYTGAFLRNYINSYDGSSTHFREQFLGELLELRATYRQLKDVVTEMITSGHYLVSENTLGTIAGDYYSHRTFIESFPQSDFEREISRKQLGEFSDIIPTRLPSASGKDFSVSIQFNVLGKSGYFVLGHTPD